MFCVIFGRASLIHAFDPLYMGKPLNEYFYSEDPDEMQHNAAFHQDLHCL